MTTTAKTTTTAKPVHFDQNQWGNSVAQYLQLRRHGLQRLMTAADSTGQASPTSQHKQHEQHEQEGHLFAILTLLLADKLNEGHTVLMLNDHQNEEGNNHEQARHWLFELLDTLLQPLNDYVPDVVAQSSLAADEAATASLPRHRPISRWLLPHLDKQLASLNASNTLNAAAFADANALVAFVSRLALTSVSSPNDGNSADNTTAVTPSLPSVAAANISKPALANINYRTELAVGFCRSLLIMQGMSDKQSIAQEAWASLSQLPFATLLDLLGHNAFIRSAQEQQAKSTPIVFEQFAPNSVSLWLHRSWQAEASIACHIMRISGGTPTPLPMDTLMQNSDLNDEQRHALQVVSEQAFCIITGGPGTGKTFTVAQLVMALFDCHTDRENEYESKTNTDTPPKPSLPMSIALAAPTGKAAQRMQESLQQALGQANVHIAMPDAKTVHRLLGIGLDGLAKYNKDMPLSESLIIVDEASMLGVELASQLLAAVKTGARLILLGDAKQLAAVEAGAVLSDLCRLPAITPMYAALIDSRRFDANSGIGKFAELIEHGSIRTKANDPKLTAAEATDADSDLAALNTSDAPNMLADSNSDLEGKLERLFADNDDLEWLPGGSVASKYAFMQRNFEAYVDACQQLLPSGTGIASGISDEKIETLFAAFNCYRVLTAGHNGAMGDDAINQHLSLWHKQRLHMAHLTGSHLLKNWYHGRPIMIRKNNYPLGLFNGDIGICLQTPKGMQVFIDGRIDKPLPITQLNEAELATAYAMTIHKSQGSEFYHVSIALDPQSGRLLSRELIYTGVTRAKMGVSMMASPSALTHAIKTPTIRQTGLAMQFD